MENLKDAEARKNRTTTNPYAKAGIFSKMTFAYLLPLFYKGYRRGLTEDDIYPHLSSHDSKILGERLEKQWNKELKNSKDPSLWRAFAKVFGREMMTYGLGILMFEMLRLTLPLSLAKLLEYFNPNSTTTFNEACIYAGIIGGTTVVQITIIHHSMFHVFHLGMRLRVAAVALVYRKAIRLSKSALAETTIGQMVNLISNDVSRFEMCTVNVHNIWIGPIQLVVLLFLLLSYAGWTGLIGVGVLLCIIPFQIWMGKKTSLYRLRTAIKTDERIRLMNEIISGMQVIKMYTWEKPFTKIVEIVRRLEMNEIRKNSFLKAIHLSFNVFLTRTLIYSCVVVHVLLGNNVNPQYIFGLSLFYELLRQCLSQAFAQGVAQVAEAIISTRRIKEFLLYDELEPEFTLISSSGDKNQKSGLSSILVQGSVSDSSQPIGVSLENVSTKWIKSHEELALKGIDFEVNPGELATIIGKVGSGKTTLLHVILKELEVTAGKRRINGVISFASQEPWLFVGTVRQNILFGQDFDVVKYHEVVRVCALQRDLKLFPHGDRTLIGERGVSLSGGQRARINLARAVYKSADIYLLDDPLSAVDAHVGKQIFKECIDGYLKDKCVVLVTHQLQYLKDCKKIYLLNDGSVQHSGTYEDIKQGGKDFKVLLEELKKMEEEAKKEEEVRKRKRTMSAKSVAEDSTALEEPTFGKEDKIDGKVTWGMYKSYLLAGGSACKLFFMGCVFIFSQALASMVDYFLSVWVNMEEMKQARNITGEVNDTLIDSLDDSQYTVFQKFWFGFLTDDVCLLIYTGLMAVVIPLIVGRAIYFFNWFVSASINLHNNMFSKIVHAPMRFFNLNPSGRILNRFSKDINMVDEYLPVTLSDTVQIGLMIGANIIVVSTVIPFILLPTGVILVIFYLIRTVFIATSRDIKRFEALTRSPIYSHLTASLQGLTTIRAFGAQNMVKQEFDNYQDAYSSSYFMFLAANRSFGYWLDLHTSIFVTLVTFSFVLLKTDSYGGSVGLAVTQAINLAGWFSFGIRQWSEMENTMISVERIKEYADVVPEADAQAREPPASWPQSGEVKFVNVGLRYGDGEPYVLKQLNFSIKTNEKIGIVGRTGAGKSSIISALFRLADIDGQILIDNIDSKTIPLNKLRSSLSIIPQEPVLFSGTLRKNLDPFDEYNDQTIWNALEEVELKSAVSDLPHGLESHMSEGGSNFSVGQRQLVCLARAIVRRNKILVLDEATASVDPHTDGLIQTTIRKKFSGCTVLTIAHRLHTIMDSDKVLVMDAGRAMEFDHPHKLLEDARGVFYSLVQQTGKAMASNLADIAAKNYQDSRAAED
ncbi:hypothetical protein HUJ04_005722 [Dendroctonus ponderosae]|uniref:Multidrug resistance-associated protein lethal(2)03659 n=1 Tax=Dendroctonus ponderosae TaxID=77166 RepID=A0AAR5P4L0_DENPD|nr:hypothetical protein HUJ04_005722 [Dendroctonus ponderosae]